MVQRRVRWIPGMINCCYVLTRFDFSHKNGKAYTVPLSEVFMIRVINHHHSAPRKQLLITLSPPSGREVKEIIIVSSGSIDKTDGIIRSIQSPLLTLVQEHTRKGKVSALKKAASLVHGDVILLIDGDVNIDNSFSVRTFLLIYRLYRQQNA